MCSSRSGWLEGLRLRGHPCKLGIGPALRRTFHCDTTSEQKGRCIAGFRSGRCLKWVNMRNTRSEYFTSDMPTIADIGRTSRNVRVVPIADIKRGEQHEEWSTISCLARQCIDVILTGIGAKRSTCWHISLQVRSSEGGVL